MSDWTRPKRFWTEVETRIEPGGFGIALDGRPVRTPGKSPLVLPTAALARLVAAEWDGVGERIDPRRMPATRMANSAIEKVAPHRTEVAAHLATYAETDLLSHRADAPEELVLRQAEGWDPLLDWAEDRLGARLAVTTGVLPVAQDVAALARLRERVEEMDPFGLTAFHDLVGLSGSLVIAFAVAEGRLGPEEGWRLSRIDEDWQEELWGRDEEAAARAEEKSRDFGFAAAFYRASRDRRAS